MTPVDQENVHNPAAGVYGDCQRACIATLLDLPCAAVPNFLVDNSGDGAAFTRRINEFLHPRGLTHLETTSAGFRFDEDFPVYHMIYGLAERGLHHAVVARNGIIVHDPHPSKAGLLDSGRAEWTYGFLLHTGGAPGRRPS